MKKSELKTGMVIKTREDCMGIVMLNSVHGDVIAGNKEDVKCTWKPLDALDEDLKYPCTPEADIMEVYNQGSGNMYAASIKNHGLLLWERTEEEKTAITLDGVDYSESTLRSLIKKATK